MWFLIIDGLIYGAYGFASRRLREKLLPIRPTEVVQTVIDTLHFKIAHEDVTVYNAVQNLLYIIVILVGILPGSPSGSGTIFRPGLVARRLSDRARAAFCRDGGGCRFSDCACGLALLVPKTLWAMIAGGP